MGVHSLRVCHFETNHLIELVVFSVSHLWSIDRVIFIPSQSRSTQIGEGEIDKHSYGTGIDEVGSLVHHENLLWI